MPYKDPEQGRQNKKEYYAARREAVREYQANYRKMNKEKLAAQRKKYYYANQDDMIRRSSDYYHSHRPEVIAKRRKRSYGITGEEFEAMFQAQDCRCAICRTTDFGFKGPCVDHDHVTKMVRGILCNTCNRTIGLLGEDILRMKTMIAYIRKANTWAEKDVPEEIQGMVS